MKVRNHSLLLYALSSGNSHSARSRVPRVFNTEVDKVLLSLVSLTA